MESTNQNQFRTSCEGLHNPSLVFPTLQQWKNHRKTCKWRNKMKDEAFYKCLDCNLTFCSDRECDIHYNCKKHLKQVRKREIESKPDFIGYPCSCHGTIFETFRKMIDHEQGWCWLCKKTYPGNKGVKQHLRSNTHAERVKWDFHQQVQIWLGNQAQTWEERRIEKRRIVNRRSQKRFRSKRKELKGV